MTGASGRLSRAVAQKLTDRGLAGEVLVISRDPSRVSNLAELGLAVRAADFGDPASLQQPLQGVDALLLISVTGSARERVPLHRNAIDALIRAGVSRVVYTSRVAPRAASAYPFAATHEDSERRLKSSGTSWTFLRNNEYAENLGPWLQEAATNGELRFGAKGPIDFVTRAEVVEAAVPALTTDGHDGTFYELSGPEGLDRGQLAAVLPSAIGHPVRAPGASREDYGALPESQGRPSFIVDMVGKGLYDSSAAGEWAAPTQSGAPAGAPAHPGLRIHPADSPQLSKPLIDTTNPVGQPWRRQPSPCITSPSDDSCSR
jgi:NAD(P)H dehydrogenase (quinone)